MFSVVLSRATMEKSGAIPRHRDKSLPHALQQRLVEIYALHARDENVDWCAYNAETEVLLGFDEFFHVGFLQQCSLSK